MTHPMACVTRDSSPIFSRSLTQRRATVVCGHSYHANTGFSRTSLGRICCNIFSVSLLKRGTR